MAYVTQILKQIESGEATAGERLLPLVYDELRKLAAVRLANEKPGHTLQATELVHEAWLRLVDVDATPQWNSRGHFFGAAAQAMRRILVEQARRKKSLKSGAGFTRITLAGIGVEEDDCLDLDRLDSALTELERERPRKAEVVKLRFFAGLTIAQVAKALGISHTTVENDWAYAKSWLCLQMADS